MSSIIEDEIKIEYKESLEEDPLAENVPIIEHKEVSEDPPPSALVSVMKHEETLEKPLTSLVSDVEHEETAEKPLAELVSEVIDEESLGKDPLSVRMLSKSGILLPKASVSIVEANKAAQLLQEVEKKGAVPDDNELQEVDGKAPDPENEDNSGYMMDIVDKKSEDTATWYKTIDSYGKLVCNFCDRTYSVLTSLRYHVTLKHPEEVASLKKKILQKRRTSHPTCHLCKKRFKSLTDLKSHIKEHKIENVANSCRYCNAAFSNTPELIEHLNNNHNVLQKKRHICNTCGYRTHKLSHLKQHMKTHLTEKRNKCTYCDYATNHKSNLKNHERIHTKHKPFICDFKGCGKGFSDITGLNYHTQKHFPEKNTIHCDKCSYRTVYKQSLKVHIEGHLRR